jgi:hypothetical protein
MENPQRDAKRKRVAKEDKGKEVDVGSSEPIKEPKTIRTERREVIIDSMRTTSNELCLLGVPLGVMCWIKGETEDGYTVRTLNYDCDEENHLAPFEEGDIQGYIDEVNSIGQHLAFEDPIDLDEEAIRWEILGDCERIDSDPYSAKMVTLIQEVKNEESADGMDSIILGRMCMHKIIVPKKKPE